MSDQFRHHAIISWVPASKGRRLSPPPGPRFVIVARFENDITWPGEAWSLVVDCQEKRRDGHIWIAEIGWLSQAGPHAAIVAGGRFELYEGRKLVANGLVMNATELRPGDDRVGELVLM